MSCVGSVFRERPAFGDPGRAEGFYFLRSLLAWSKPRKRRQRVYGIDCTGERARSFVRVCSKQLGSRLDAQIAQKFFGLATGLVLTGRVLFDQSKYLSGTFRLALTYEQFTDSDEGIQLQANRHDPDCTCQRHPITQLSLNCDRAQENILGFVIVAHRIVDATQPERGPSQGSGLVELFADVQALAQHLVRLLVVPQVEFDAPLAW